MPLESPSGQSGEPTGGAFYNGAAIGPQVPPETVQAQLQRIVAHPIFSRAERSGRLLSFLVVKVLHGEAGELTQYLIATEVFKRGEAFDPEGDAIVRVEASRLRRRLQEYYDVAGQDDPVLIELLQRSYIPVFRPRDLPAANRVEKSTSRGTFGAGHVTAVGLVALLIAGTWLIFLKSTALGGPPSVANSTGEIWRGAPAAVSSSMDRSIAVLPFSDLSPAKDQDYFCDGLAEEMIDTLSRVEGLHVVSRTSAFHFKGKMDDVRRIGAELNVRMVLEGSVRKDGKKLRVTVQLVNAADGYHIWSQAFDRELQDVYAIQRDIARGIVRALRPQLRREYWLRPLEGGRPGLEAYYLYLHGLQLAGDGSNDALRQAARYYQQALQIDPKYAAAYAGLAECYAMLGVYAASPSGELMAKAKSTAEKALELDSKLPDAHSALGLAKALGAWDWAGAALEFQYARELDPSDSSVREAYVTGYLIPMGRLDDALREIREAQTFDPVSARLSTMAGVVHFFRREHDQAIAELRQALEMDPSFHTAHITLGSVYEQKGMFAEAAAAFQKGMAAPPDGMANGFLGHTYARMGKRAEAQALLDELIRLSDQKYVSPLDIAIICTGLGDKDRAFEWLEKAYAQRVASLAYLNVNPRFDPLRSDPRFINLVRKIHLQ